MLELMFACKAAVLAYSLKLSETNPRPLNPGPDADTGVVDVVVAGVLVAGGGVVTGDVRAGVDVFEELPLTITVLFPEAIPVTTVIVTTPGRTPFTTPVVLATVATVVSLEDHIVQLLINPETSCPDALLMTDDKVVVAPTATVTESGVM